MNKKKEFNQSIAVCKFIASLFIIFIHFPLPGTLGNFIKCIARFSVPIFFCISGYYSYNISNEKIISRLKYIFKLNIISSIIYFIYEIFNITFLSHQNILDYFKYLFNINIISNFILFNNNPFSEHLWYLSAMIVCYIIYYIYNQFYKGKKTNFNPLYLISFILLIINIFCGTLLPATNINVNYIIYRNALCFGIPFFSLGIFIKQYKNIIINNYKLNNKKIITFIFIGFILSLIQNFGIGDSELPAGIIITTIGLILLLVSNPTISNSNNIIANLNNISLIIYIVHPLIYNIMFNNQSIHFISIIMNNNYLYTFTILIISLIIAILYCLIINKLIHKKRHE